MTYVDAFVLSVPKDKVDFYRTILSRSWELWKEYGATHYVECIGDDVPYGSGPHFREPSRRGTMRSLCCPG